MTDSPLTFAKDWPNCLACDTPLTGQTTTSAEAVAAARTGDLSGALNDSVSLCVHCGNVAILVVGDTAVSLRAMTPGELAELFADEEFLAAYQRLGHDPDRLARAFWSSVTDELEKQADGDLDTRAAHLSWCRDRALPYAESGDPANMMASLVQDLAMRPETLAMVTAASYAMYDLAMFSGEPTPENLLEWLDAFCGPGTAPATP